MKKASLLTAALMTCFASMGLAKDTKPNSNYRTYDQGYRTEEQKRMQRDHEYDRRTNPQTARGYNRVTPIGQGMEKDSSGAILESTTFRE